MRPVVFSIDQTRICQVGGSLKYNDGIAIDVGRQTVDDRSINWTWLDMDRTLD